MKDHDGANRIKADHQAGTHDLGDGAGVRDIRLQNRN